MSESYGRIAPGTRRTLHGIDVVAVDQDAPENTTSSSSLCGVGDFVCPFNDKQECGTTRCKGVIWLTVPDYTAHRLTR